MREIKFRAWVNTQIDPFMTYEISDLDFNDWSIGCNDSLSFSDSEYELMQYTGLKDKNGTEIYEGDIVISDNQGTKDEVIFSSGCFCLKKAVMQYEASYWGNEIEVIGNIYEND